VVVIIFGTLFFVFVFLIVYDITRPRVEEFIRSRIGEFISGTIEKPPVIKEEERRAKKAYDANSILYGLAYEDLVVHGTLHDDGSMTIGREIKLRAYLPNISSIDHYLIAPEAPKTGDLIETKNLIFKSPFRTLPWKEITRTPNRISILISIFPALKVGETLAYELREKIPMNAMATTLEKLKEHNMDYESFEWDIGRPAKNLSLNVWFPEHLAPTSGNVGVDVWYSPDSRLTHEEEYRRIEKHHLYVKEGTQWRFELSLPYPVVGLTYVLKWVPPPQQGRQLLMETMDRHNTPSKSRARREGKTNHV